MAFGESQAEKMASTETKKYMNQLPAYLNQGQSWMNTGLAQLNGINGKIGNYIGGLGNDPTTIQLRSQLNDIMSGQGAEQASAATVGSAAQASAQQAIASNIAMQGKTFAQQFGSQLGGLALQQKNMQTVADKLASTTDNPFAVLSKGAMEDAALQNAAGFSQLRSQLAAQGLDATSGTGAAALAALQFNTNKQVADAYRQNAVQGAQFQQQGLGMAGGLYNQMANLDLQSATTQAQLGLQGYQADIGNAQRLDQVNMQNAQLSTQANLANAAAQNQVNLSNADAQTRVSMANASSNNQWKLAGLQGLMSLQNSHDDAVLRAYGLMSQNSGQYLQAGSNMWGSALGAQGNLIGMLNQNAMANAQGRGSMWGGLISGGLGLLGTAIGGPLGGALGSQLGGMMMRKPSSKGLG